jgi:hypothetical protein
VRAGDYITLTPAEAALLRSDDFKQVAPAEAVRKMRLVSEPGQDYQRLSLPKVGKPVAQALETLAASARGPRASIAAGLARRIEDRLR